MGTWGAGPFDNDDAADWTWSFDGLDADAGVQLLRDALTLDDGPVDADDGVTAVAAAQVVAWMADPSAIDESPYAESVVTWLRSTSPTADAGLIAAARAALDRVAGDGSELAELWDEAEDPAWREEITRLRAQLPG